MGLVVVAGLADNYEIPPNWFAFILMGISEI